MSCSLRNSQTISEFKARFAFFKSLIFWAMCWSRNSGVNEMTLISQDEQACQSQRFIPPPALIICEHWRTWVAINSRSWIVNWAWRKEKLIAFHGSFCPSLWCRFFLFCAGSEILHGLRCKHYSTIKNKWQVLRKGNQATGDISIRVEQG